MKIKCVIKYINKINHKEGVAPRDRIILPNPIEEWDRDY